MNKLNRPYLSVDPIKMAIARAIPSYELDTNAGSIKTAEQLWPFLSTLILNMIETKVDCIVEGEILPKHVHELTAKNETNIHACFVGYCDISASEKFQQIRENSGFPNDWSSEISDEELLRLIEESIQYSQYLKSECSKYNIKYIDFSQSFENAKRDVISYFVRSAS
jgi:hypothetical protein